MREREWRWLQTIQRESGDQSTSTGSPSGLVASSRSAPSARVRWCSTPSLVEKTSDFESGAQDSSDFQPAPSEVSLRAATSSPASFQRKRFASERRTQTSYSPLSSET